LMLLSDNPGKPFEYPFTLLKIDGPTSATSIMHGPTTARFYGHKAYVALVYGFEWTFIISSHSDHLTDEYPFVGVLPELVILIDRKTQREFLHEIRSNMPNMTR